MSKEYVLVTVNADYADEFDCLSFGVYKAADWADLNEKVKEVFNKLKYIDG